MQQSQVYASVGKLVGLFVAMILVSACGSSAHVVEPAADGPLLGDDGSYRLTSDENVQLYFAGLRGVNEASAGHLFGRILADYLPNQKFVVNGEEPKALSSGVVVGTVTRVDKGPGFIVPNESRAAVPVDFDDPAAVWRIARVTIEVEEWLGAERRDEEVVTIGAMITHEGSEAAEQLAGIAKLARVAVVLDPDRVYDWDADVRVVARGGVLFGDIDSDGFIGFPALGGESGSFVSDVETVGKLLASSSAERTPIQVSVDMKSGIITR